MIPSIEFRGVSKFFGNIIALKDISFKVFKGESVFLHPSGSTSGQD